MTAYIAAKREELKVSGIGRNPIAERGKDHAMRATRESTFMRG